VGDDVPFVQSKCRGCQHLREVKTARSTFLMCTQGTPPKYPPQPVRECAFFVASTDQQKPR
jgi:hypothetical protein